MRVLHLIYGLNAGGAETLMYHIAETVDRRKYEFSFLVFKKSQDEQFYEEKMRKLGCKVMIIQYQNYIQSRREMIDLFNKGKYDIIHIHNAQCDKLFDVFLAHISNCEKVIVHSHNSAIQPNVKMYRMRVKMQELLKGFYSKLADGYIACSDMAAKWSFSKSLVDSGKIFWLKNGIHVEDFAFSAIYRNQLRTKYGMEDKFIIGHVGKYDYQKNHRFIIEVFKCIEQKNNKAQLVLIGSGALKKDIVDLVERYGIKNKVLFIDQTSDVGKYMSMMDVFLFPSLFEGLPVVGVECQAASLMAVVSNTITDEVAISHYWNTMSLSESPDMWASVILQYACGYKRGDGEMEVRNSGFSIEDTTKDLCNYYDELLRVDV